MSNNDLHRGACCAESSYGRQTDALSHRFAPGMPGPGGPMMGRASDVSSLAARGLDAREPDAIALIEPHAVAKPNVAEE